MNLPENRFKKALKDQKQQIGLWCTINEPTVVEMLALCGYDWLLIDTEHSSIDTSDTLRLMQAVAPHPASVAIRPSALNVAEIKKLLDFGAQTLLVPQIQDAEEARLAAAAVDYAPAGIRGVAGLTRATRYANVPDYHARARSEICLLIQVETVRGVENLDAILEVHGIDGVFVGPADLATSMGYPGQPTHPEVRKLCVQVIRRIRDAGLAAGFLSLDRDTPKEMISAGSLFTAVNVDAALLKYAAEDTVSYWRKVLGG
jgi:4-hydroxy-2-oxoheptanedioate aldolase